MTGVVNSVSIWLTVQAADNGDAERLAQFGASSSAEHQRQAPRIAAIVVIMIGRKRNRQAW